MMEKFLNNTFSVIFGKIEINFREWANSQSSDCGGNDIRALVCALRNFLYYTIKFKEMKEICHFA